MNRGAVVGTLLLAFAACSGEGDPLQTTTAGVGEARHSLAAYVAAHDAILRTRPQATQFLVDRVNLVLAKEGILGTVVKDVESRVLSPLTDGAAPTTCPYLTKVDGANTVSCRFLVDRALTDALVESAQLDDAVEQDIDRRHGAILTRAELDFVKQWGGQAILSGIDVGAVHAADILRADGVCDQAPAPSASAFNLGAQQGQALLEATEQTVLPTIPKTQCNTDVIAATVHGEAQAAADGFMEANPICAGFDAKDLAQTVDLTQAEQNRRDGVAEGLRQAYEALRVRLVNTWECEACVCYARYGGSGPVFCFNQQDIAGHEPTWGGEAQDLATSHPEWTVPQDQCSDAPIPLGSPLVVDLDGDGIRLARERVSFDLAATGEPVLIPSLAGADAFLALDLDGDGRVGSGAELFGNATMCGRARCADGIAALARHDANHDGLIDERDPVFGQLRLWRDVDRDGRSSPEELLPLGAAGIEEIGLTSRLDAGFVDRDGNSAMRAVSYRRADGSTGLVADVWFRLDFETLPRDPRTSGVVSTLSSRHR